MASHFPANSGYGCAQLLSRQKCASQLYSPLAICIEQKPGCPDSTAQLSVQQLRQLRRQSDHTFTLICSLVGRYSCSAREYSICASRRTCPSQPRAATIAVQFEYSPRSSSGTASRQSSELSGGGGGASSLQNWHDRSQ